jgi:hypothetical protein
VITYLHRVGLLDKVRLLSTVSGGTFTGAKLTLTFLENKPFEKFVGDYYKELRNFRIFEEALKLLGGSEPLGNPSGQRNIITCAAHVYSKFLFKKPDGGPYHLEDILNGNTGNLQEITFNATDFRTGLAFRFQKTATGGLIGNRTTRLAPAEAGMVRLGDVVAASSCFPGGFEPLVFPHDLAWKGGVPVGIRSQFAPAPSPLMDGGVYDNQGLESLYLADMRVQHPPSGIPARDGADLIFISDTDRVADTLYQVPDGVKDTVLRSHPNLAVRFLAWLDPKLKWLDWVSKGMIVLCGLVVAAIGIDLAVTLLSPQPPHWAVLLLTSILPLLLAAGTAFLVHAARGLVRKDLLAKIPQVQSAGWEHLRELRLSRAVDMCLVRLSSLLAMASGVFMKRIRSSGLNRIYTDDSYKGRVVANLIYQLTPGYPWAFAAPESDEKMLPGWAPELVSHLKAIPAPSDILQKVAKVAADVPTTLWFTSDDELPALVASGQFTTCLNLMKFVARTRTFAPAGECTGEVGPLWRQLVADWRRFQTDPYFVLGESIPEAVPSKTQNASR